MSKRKVEVNTTKWRRSCERTQWKCCKQCQWIMTLFNYKHHCAPALPVLSSFLCRGCSEQLQESLIIFNALHAYSVEFSYSFALFTYCICVLWSFMPWNTHLLRLKLIKRKKKNECRQESCESHVYLNPHISACTSNEMFSHCIYANSVSIFKLVKFSFVVFL